MNAVKSLCLRSNEHLSLEYRVDIPTDDWRFAGHRSLKVRVERGGKKPSSNTTVFGASRLRLRFAS